ncbi:MAG: Glycosyl hydrolase family 57 [Chloroflexi bacterium ADurb.Bin325]|nr:MAG: Glycosyl hydrolase family 57 [Chloroflexi bacterium ADurb.Bin325]
MHPLYIAFVWHMHQPDYRDLRTGEIPMPWVRLHAAKDYLHMAEVLARYPAVHATINMAPSLTEQMLAWVEDADDAHADDLWRLAEQETWSTADKRRIIDLCFSISWDRVIRSYPRYAQLLDRRPQALADPETFTDQDIRDLVAWFNLVWIDPGWRDRDPGLKRLVQQGQGFTLADVRMIHAAQRRIAAGVAPLYRRLAAAGQLELSASPYFHPILPLLVDTDVAGRATPGLPLPEPPFCAPEDAAAQLQMAVASHTAHYGAAPAGLWPSEGAVSPEILPLVRLAGFNWLASSETILSRSLGRPLDRDGSSLLTDPRTLYQPYRVLAGTELGPYMIFRDQELADRIGFLYQHLPGQQAAEDLIYRLLEIRRRLNDTQTPYLVSIILDGENCWEHYERNGDIFLEAFYGELSRRPELRAVTVSEYLALRRQPAATLARLATGSWIGGDLTTWIGDPEHNRAWAALRRTREHIVAYTAKTAGAAADEEVAARLQRAWYALYAAEGSDWFWWYSHRNSSQQDALFDRLYRNDLIAVFEALGDPAPEWLAQSIRQAPAAADHRPAQGYISPLLTAAAYPSMDWADAAQFQPASASTGTMQRGDRGAIERLFVGHDQHNLYLRLDLRAALDAYDLAIYLSGAADGPTGQQIRAHYRYPAEPPAQLAVQWEVHREPGQAAPFLYRADGHGGWSAVGPVVAALGEKTLEASIPLAALGLAQPDEAEAQLPETAMGTVTLARF